MVINPAVAPSVTYPSPFEFPETVFTISGISPGNQTKLTVAAHGFTEADVGITTVDILQVQGMRRINGLPGRITAIVDANNFIVDINSTNFYPYTGGGVISIVTGQPPFETVSFQTFNTPFQNTF